MTILVTGFEPFGGADVNPSAELVAALKTRDGVLAEVLPTSFAASGPRLLSHMDQHKPRAILMFGVHGEAVRPRLERVALNFDHADIADNNGDLRQSTPIRQGARLALESNVDVVKLQAALRDHMIKVDLSHHAGTYVCNHAYYMALDYLSRSGKTTPCLFTHIPKFGEKPDEEVQSLVRLVDSLIDALTQCGL